MMWDGAPGFNVIFVNFLNTPGAPIDNGRRHRIYLGSFHNDSKEQPMKSFPRFIAAAFAGLLAALPLSADPAHDHDHMMAKPGSPALERMKQLAGVWEG